MRFKECSLYGFVNIMQGAYLTQIFLYLAFRAFQPSYTTSLSYSSGLTLEHGDPSKNT